MRVCLLVPDLRPSGGIAVVLGYANRLGAAGDFDIDVVSQGSAREFDGQSLSLRSLDDARNEDYDVAIATWWETVPAVLTLRAGRRALLVQSAEERFYRRHEPFEQLGPALSLSAPVHFFAVARWLCDLLAELRPGCSCWFTPNGIDKATFTPRTTPVGDGPLRILIEGQHTLWFKGVEDALDAVDRMSEPHSTTLVALDPADAPERDGLRVVGGLSGAQMRDLYEQHDVLVKLSRIESVGMAVVEAAHVGTPAVVTPYTGHDEIIRHGENGVVVGFDDPDGCARTLDTLARDRDVLRSLSDAAVASMSEWPSDDQATALFADALRELAEAPAPSPGDAARAGLARWRAATEIARVKRGETQLRTHGLEGSVEWLENALETERATSDAVRAEYHELAQSREELDALLKLRDRQLAEVKSSRAYRAAVAARSVAERFRR